MSAVCMSTGMYAYVCIHVYKPHTCICMSLWTKLLKKSLEIQVWLIISLLLS